jgi:hypothetical protein
MTQTHHGYYLPGPNDHGDVSGEVIFAALAEIASLFQTEPDDLSFIDYGKGRMFVRQGMQLAPDAPVNSAATTFLKIHTTLEGLAIRGPAITFARDQAPDLPALNQE